MTSIRLATAVDTEAIVAMALRFQVSSEYAAYLRGTETTFRALTTAILGNHEACIWVAERDGRLVGMLALVVMQQPMSQERLASELCWWLDPDIRGGRTAIRLLWAAEAWAREHGAVLFQMAAPNPQVGRLYEALQYVPIETHYQRRIA